MTERPIAPYGGGFWTLVSWVCALFAGVIFAIIFGSLYGAGIRGGMFFGAIIFVGVGWFLSVYAVAPPRSAAKMAQEPAAPRAKARPAEAVAPPLPVAAIETVDIEVEQVVETTYIPDPTPSPRAVGLMSGAPSRPAGLAAAREGGADDLKKIKGVGPKLEELLHSLGYYHFDQIAAWTEAEVAWVDSNLEGFNGRATRDEWIAQARVLASGGETEFSQRVDKGEVY